MEERQANRIPHITQTERRKKGRRSKGSDRKKERKRGYVKKRDRERERVGVTRAANDGSLGKKRRRERRLEDTALGFAFRDRRFQRGDDRFIEHVLQLSFFIGPKFLAVDQLIGPLARNLKGKGTYALLGQS